MLERVIAVRFDRRMNCGKTWPCQLACRRDDGGEVEVVAKFSAGCERQVGALVVEAIAAMLAADLDLPCPEPLLVAFDLDFVGLVRATNDAVADRLSASVPVAFGSAKLPAGFMALPPDRAISQSLRQQAAEIFAFDALIQNPDRRPENPNCLSDGGSYAVFDHELALMTNGIVGWIPPWVRGGLDSFARVDKHAFFADLRGRDVDLGRLKGAWEALSDARLGEYRQALPPEWNSEGELADGALRYIAQVRDNIDPALAEIGRVLS